ncbi:hypothetical protein LTR84_003559 [Exophiala bonariae]|uniref:INSIG domain-containing protein n=1 Tax=Exophiala bonariae TaxID=1690606 RepID=A0AAV9N783_9EURO|nr:hypothetical protein LTR84_003559 [Exophiala bonariae]
MEMPHLHRPIPRRTFDITPASADSSYPPSPATEPNNPDFLNSPKPDMNPSSRTRSILNLTSSTLFGIYSPVSDGEREELSTPWGTGAQTPSHRRSIDDYRPQDQASNWDTNTVKSRPKPQRRGFQGYVVPLVIQTTLLFAFGVGYGSIVTHLHQSRRIKPVPLPNIDPSSLYHYLCWGILGVILGNALPLVDSFWEQSVSSVNSASQTVQKSARAPGSSSNAEREGSTSSNLDNGTGPMWYSTVRSMGAFVGIAFAVRRIPWQSTFQVALSLAFANPVLWYVIDRSLPGFAFSALVGILGTTVLLVVDPSFVPVPAIHQSMASEQFGVFTWLASILFCTSICFGAIGRRLQL